MSMPYSTDLRPDTGLYNGKLGMWFFLAAEAMFFGALFSSYAFLRTASASWPDGAKVLPLLPALLVFVALILAASMTAQTWAVSLNGGRPSSTRLWLIAGASLAAAGLIFLGLRMEFREGMTPATHTFYACWFLICTLIAGHATAAGAYALALLWPRVPQDSENTVQMRNRVECLGLFLQFVALTWFATFACFYVI